MTGWEGIGSNRTLEPPDPHGAAGPNGIIQVVNVDIAYWDKLGNPIWGPRPMDSFFTSVGNQYFSFDPMALFDPETGRFFVLILEEDDNSQSSYLNLAVSKTSDPATDTASDWYFYRIDNKQTNGAAVYWGDNPRMGFDSQALYITCNMYSFITNANGNVQITVLDKAGLISGTANPQFVYTTGGPGVGFALVPCTVMGTNSPGNTAYFGETRFGFSTSVRVWALTDPLGARTLTSTTLTVPDNGGPPPFSGAPQAGTSITIDPSDGRTLGNAFWHNGSIWFCHSAGGSSGKASVYYYNVALNGYPGGTPTLIEEGSIDGGPGEWTYMPAIGGNSQGDICIVYSQSSLTRYPAIMVTTRKAGAVAFDTPVEIKSSPSFYLGGRWGDYASVTPDPVDDSFWVTHEFARSSQIIDWGTWWANVIAKIAPDLRVATNYLSGGNGNGTIDFNECNELSIVLTNVGSAGATNVQATLSTTTPGVIVAQRNSPYPDMPIGAGATNLVPFRISTTPTFVCGTPVDLALLVKSDEGSRTNFLRFSTGTNGIPVRFDYLGPAVVVPDANPTGTNVPLVVSNITGAIFKVTVSLFMTHTFDADMLIELIAPDRTRVVLSANNGGAGDNYGVSCSPNSFRTTFDDDARSSITAAVPPFNGSFRPEQPLSAFVGKFGTNVNGIWQLRLVDQAFIDVGRLQCWSLEISPAGCIDGGGECPGSDMAIGMRANPEPVVIGNNLSYSISVTNFGPSTAKGVTVTHVLPPSAVFVSASASQGTAVQSGGTVVGSLGNIAVGASASMTVVVTPTSAGAISSSAAVGSSQADPDLSNNSVTVVSHVNPPSADLAVGLADAPDPALVGGSLTYLVSVTNKGPSIASGVRVTNSLPDSVAIQNVSVSQGVVSVDGHTVVITFGSITNNAIATAGIQVTPSVEGTLTATAVVSGNLPDPVLPNNTAVATTSVGAAADLGVSLLATPDPVVFGSNLTYVISVTNRGPSAATSVLVSQTLPTGVTVLSSNTSQGTFTLTNGTLSCAVGNLPIGGSVTIIVVVRAGAVGTLVSTVNVASAQADPNSSDNDASASTVVAPPFVSVVAAGAKLTAESFAPPNGTVDPGETVTVELRLRNAGNVANTNLVATLLATGGVTSPSGPQTYGAMPAGSFPVSKPFTFTASGAAGGSVTATLQLQDGPNNLGTVNFTFQLPNVFTFSNTNEITIPDEGNASPYPATIQVSGVTGLVSKVTATFVDFTHTFPHDVSALLAGPTGVDVVLMSHVADGSSVADADVIFDDTASAALPASGSIGSGNWRPAAYPPTTIFGNPAPNPPYDTVLSAFNGLNPNGIWSLFVKDDSAGDQGNISGGWRLAITTVTPVNQVADVSISGTASPNPSLVAGTLTYSFTVANSGPGAASSVAFTNTLPGSLMLVSANSSQGSASANGNTAIVNLGGINVGGSATVTIVARPLAAGSIANTATVASPESDLNLANNTITVTSTVNLPVANVALANVAAPEPVVIGSNLTYTLTVTNAGPNNALNVVVSDSLPAGISYVSGAASQGTVNQSSGTVTASLGTVLPGTTATVTINATPTSAGVVTNAATVVTASSDGNSANNTAVAITTVVNPAPKIVAAGSTLVSESQRPANGAIDAGETISISLSLANVGSADTANLVATLQPTGGVNSPSGPQNYGVLVRGGPSVARTFTFNASAGTGLIVARLQLQDGANDLGTVSFVYSLPITSSFTNTTPITIPDHGSAQPYPSAIAVSGVTGIVDKVTVTLNGLTHGFPDDVNMMLVGPDGQKMILLSGAGGGHAVTNVTLTFADDAGTALADAEQIVSGSYAPTNYKGTINFPPPAPGGAAPSTLSVFSGGSPNGTWALYIFDDTSGDAGGISDGWSLSIRTVVPINPLADLAISMSGNSGPVYTGSGVTYDINIVNNGPANATNVVVADALPAGMVLVSASSSKGTYSNANGIVTFNLGNLDSGATATASILASPALAGIASNVVSVLANELDVDPANNLAFVLTTVVAPLPAALTISPTNAQFLLVLTGEPGQTYVIQASSNFSSWVPIYTDVAAGGTVKFTTTDAQNFQYRFYRAVRVP